MAHGACSRLEPLPKFCPASSTTAPSCSGLFITKSGSSRHPEKRNWPKPVRSMRLRASLGTIWSVSTSSQPSGNALPSTFFTGSIYLTSRGTPSSDGEAKRPITAVAAATTGLTRCVLPPLPWRPSKLRLLVEAHRSPGERMSGFMPRHIEQPARSEEHTSELQSRQYLVCRLLLEKKKFQ